MVASSGSCSHGVFADAKTFLILVTSRKFVVRFAQVRIYFCERFFVYQKNRSYLIGYVRGLEDETTLIYNLA